MEPKDVKLVQESMNVLLGTSLAVDGVVGPRTKKAVRQFQEMAGIGVDGVVGPNTRAALAKTLRQVSETALDLAEAFETGKETKAERVDWTNPADVMKKLFG